MIPPMIVKCFTFSSANAVAEIANSQSRTAATRHLPLIACPKIAVTEIALYQLELRV
jgi:hypothetical protein